VTRINDTWADNDTPLTLQLYYSGDWHDISDDLTDDGWHITRKPGEPTEFECTLHNTDGTYSVRLPTSTLYGLVGRNTPIRARITTGSVTYTRFTGEVSAWPITWTKKGAAFVTLQAAGVLRRLGQGESPTASPYSRGITSVVSPLEDVVAYWPLEDRGSASLLASGLPQGRPMHVRGDPDIGASAGDFACTSSMVGLTTGDTLGGYVTTFTDAGEWQIMFLLIVPDGGISADTPMLSVRTSSPDVLTWDLYLTTTGGARLRAYDEDGAGVIDSGYVNFLLNGHSSRIYLSAWDDGGDCGWTFSRIYVEDDTGVYWSSSFAGGAAPGAAAGALAYISIASDGGLGGCSGGQCTGQAVVTGIYDHVDVFHAHAGEEAHDRVDRLASEAGLTAQIEGDTSEQMGPQGQEVIRALLGKCATTDDGYLSDARDELTVRYRTRLDVCAQAPTAEITYTDNLLVPMTPVDDDEATRNHVIVSRADGGSATYEITDGPLSTQAPPDGVGRYEDAPDLSLYEDTQCRYQAQWRAHRGTVDAYRWPSVGVELAHPLLREDPDLVADILAVDIGDRVVISDPPSWLPPDPIDVIITGYTEDVTPSRYKITWTAEPYGPRAVAVADTDPDDRRYSGEGTELAEDLDLTETGVDVTAPVGVTWTHDDGDYEVVVDGESMDVTAIAGAWPDYTLTVTRSTNGVVRTHSAGAAIDVRYPGHLGL
jgi:hypothetical protein